MDFAFKSMKGLIAEAASLLILTTTNPFTFTLMLLVIKWEHIVQVDKPVAFWLCKLNDTQLKYIVDDK